MYQGQPPGRYAPRVEQVKAGDKVIGSVEYIGRDDVWRAQSIHQTRPQTFHDPDRARSWIRQLHADETAGKPKPTETP
jgi:hypothetical protein